MANDKDFTLTNGIEISKDTKNTVGTISASNAVDLSTGNFFTHTPAGATTYSFTNPGAVQSFQMQLTGGQEAAASSFSTTTYTGTGAAQTISNGLDLSSDGGLVWVKRRDATNSHSLWDSARGINYWLSSDNTSAQIDYSTNAMQSFNTNGFTLGTDSVTNGSGNSMVSWAFKKTPKFFDVVTYTGNGTSGRSISHSLNGNVGTILFKRTDSTSNWIVWHRSAGGAYGFLDATDAFTADSGISNPTTTAFTIESTINPGWNASGGTYVAYLFAHDTDASSLIKCGSYTGTSSSGNAVTLGWQPSWIMIKRATGGTGGWFIFDTQRGIVTSGNDATLQAESSAAEGTGDDRIELTDSGFKIVTTSSFFNNTGNTYIYIAIRSAAATAVTWPNSVKFQGGTAPETPAVGEVDTYTFTTRDGGTSYIGVQSGNNHS